MIELYPDQAILVDRVRAAFRAGSRAPLLVSPTGSGKTVMFGYITSNALRLGTRVGIFVHRAELVDQVSETLKNFDVPHGIIAADYGINTRAQVQVISVQTYVRRIPQVPKFGLCIADEAHHAVGGSTWATSLAHSPGARHLGVTATPQRLDGRGLGDVFDTMILGPTVRELIDLGRLSPYRLFAPTAPDLSTVHSRMGDFVKSEATGVMDKPAITGSAVSHYRQHSDYKRAAAFCCSVEHAHHVAAEFSAAGYVSVPLDGKMDKGLRRNIVRDYTAGRIHVLTSCDIISEGFDCPGIETAILLRPTQSLALSMQQRGRAMRIFRGKTIATFQDHVDDYVRHGFVDDEREWTLEGYAGKRKAGDAVVNGRRCGACFAISGPGAAKCKECGTKFEVVAREVEVRDGTLAEIDVAAARQKTPEQVERLKQQADARSLDALIALGKTRGMANPEGWARHVFAARENKRKGKAA